MDNETQEPTTAQDTEGANDPTSITAAELYQQMEGKPADIEQPEPEADKPDSSDAETSEADEESDDDEEAQDDDAQPEDAEDAEPDNFPRLDSDLEGFLAENGGEAYIKRWKDQVKGIKKLEAKQLEWQEGIQDMFNDIDYAREVIPDFLSKVAHAHGVTIPDLIGTVIPNMIREANWLGQGKTQDSGLQGDYDPSDDTPEWDQRGYDSQFELTLHQGQLALEAKVAAYEQERQRSASQAKHDQFIAKELPKVQRAFDREWNGFKVTQKMLTDAVAKFPNLSPMEAVEAANVKALADHKSSKSARAATVNARPMPKSGTAKGMDLPSDPSDLRFSHVAALIQS